MDSNYCPYIGKSIDRVFPYHEINFHFVSYSSCKYSRNVLEYLISVQDTKKYLTDTQEQEISTLLCRMYKEEQELIKLIFNNMSSS